MFNLRSLLTVLFLALIAGLPAWGMDSIDGIRTLRSADIHPDDYPTVQAVQYINQQLQRQSGRKLAIRVYSSGLLGDEANLLRLVQEGNLDMNRVSAQALENFSAAFRVLSLPFLFRDTDHLHQVLDGPIGQEILDSLSSQGLVGLAFYDAGVRNLYTRSAPIQSLSDLAKLTLRVQPSEMSAALIHALGAKPVPLALGQTRNALANGLIDGAENNLPSYSVTEHFRFAPYYTYTRHTMTPDVLVISRRTWNALSSEERAMLRQIARDSVQLMRDMWQQREDRVAASLRLAGVRFTELTNADRANFIAATVPLYARFAANADQQALIRRIKAIP